VRKRQKPWSKIGGEKVGQGQTSSTGKSNSLETSSPVFNRVSGSSDGKQGFAGKVRRTILNSLHRSKLFIVSKPFFPVSAVGPENFAVTSTPATHLNQLLSLMLESLEVLEVVPDTRFLLSTSSSLST